MLKKSLKIIIVIISLLIVTIVIDLMCIFTSNKPIFVVTEDYGEYVVYKGLFFNTYKCLEYSVPQIKGKRTKFTCAILGFENNDIENRIEVKINKIIENGPKNSSNPFDYINASKNIYDELLETPKETFEYSIKSLLVNNGNDGLKSYIEALLCSEINDDFKYNFLSAHDYITKYKEFLIKHDSIYNEYDKYTFSLIS